MAATPVKWRTWDLGAFRMQTPANLQQVAGGIDSQAGTLSADGLRVIYDFGRYSDPLERTGDTLDYQSQAGVVDGLPGRMVQFRVNDPAAATQFCSGVHVPRAQPSPSAALSLTVLACAPTVEQLAPVPAIIASIRLRASASR
ncbi:MAG: hypothetical protein ABIR55_23730 [Burkholderiaceae bacterium]